MTQHGIAIVPHPVGLDSRSMLYEAQGGDPVIFLGVSILLVVVAVLAAAIPARRASRVDPMIALRSRDEISRALAVLRTHEERWV